MKNKLLLLLLILPIFCSAMQKIDENEYIVKSGDSFLLQIQSAVSVDTLIIVLPEGTISLKYLRTPIIVSGETLKNAKQKIVSAFDNEFKNTNVFVDLAEMAPFHYNITGAVIKPGTYVSRAILTLNQVFHLSQGLAPLASKNISIFRNGRELKYDLNKFLQNGDTTQNPYIMDSDIVNVAYAKNYVKVVYKQTAFAKTRQDSVGNFAYVDLGDKKEIPLSELQNRLDNKNLDTNFSKVTVIRDNKVIELDNNSMLKNRDELYFEDENNYIFVTGDVKNAGQFLYNPNFSIRNYIALAGGISETGNRAKIFVIDSKGNKRVYEDGQLNPNETIYIQQDYVTLFNKYIKPFLTITTLFITYIQLTK